MKASSKSKDSEQALQERIFDAYNNASVPDAATVLDIDEGLVEFLYAVISAEGAAVTDPNELYEWWVVRVVQALVDARPEGTCPACAADLIRLELLGDQHPKTGTMN